MAIKVESSAHEVNDPDPILAANAEKELDGKEHQQILDHRNRFAEISYGIMQAWVGFLIVLTLGQFSLRPIGMGLTQTEFVTVFSTTTAAVFGFGLVVGNFLFPKGGSAKRRSK